MYRAVSLMCVMKAVAFEIPFLFYAELKEYASEIWYFTITLAIESLVIYYRGKCDPGGISAKICIDNSCQIGINKDCWDLTYIS